MPRKKIVPQQEPEIEVMPADTPIVGKWEPPSLCREAAHAARVLQDRATHSPGSLKWAERCQAIHDAFGPHLCLKKATASDGTCDMTRGEMVK